MRNCDVFMMKPDRIARAVEQARAGYISKFISPEQAIQLLRREAAYQRAWVRRIVKSEITTKKAEIRCVDDGDCDRGLNRPAEVHAIQREIAVCDDILAALARMTR